MAIIFPGLLVLTMIIIQAGLYYHAKQRAAAAADHGAVAAAAAGGNAAAGRRAAAAFLADMPIGRNGQRPVVQVTIGADEVQVVVTGRMDRVLPAGTWLVQATATAPVEEFIPEPDR